MATTAPFIETFRSYQSEKDNAFISHRVLVDLLIPKESLNKDDQQKMVTLGELNRLLEIEQLKGRADIDAAALEKSYKFIQTYKTVEFVIWNILCIPSSLAALIEFLIHVAQKDINWSSDIFLTFFGSAIFSILVISYAAFFIFKLSRKWGKDVDKAFVKYQESMTSLFEKAAIKIDLSSLFDLIKKNAEIIKSNWLPRASVHELNEVGFRRDNLAEKNKISTDMLKHEEKKEKFKALGILCAGGAVICVLFTSRLVHEKLKLIPDRPSLTREQKEVLEELRRRINEWIAAHPNEPKPPAASTFSSEEISQEVAAESFVGSESFVVMISIVAALTVVCAAVYAWKQYQESQCPDHRSLGNRC